MKLVSQRIVPAAVVASLAASMLLAGCSTSQPEAGADAGAPQAEAGQASQAGAVTFTDDTGAEVTVDNPQRVVACMGQLRQHVGARGRHARGRFRTTRSRCPTTT